MEGFELRPSASHSRDLVSFSEPVSVTLSVLKHSFGLGNNKLDTIGCNLSVSEYCWALDLKSKFFQKHLKHRLEFLSSL